MERSVSLATSFFNLPVTLGFLVFAALVYFAFIQIKKRPVVSFGIFWFFIALIPVSNIIIPINGLLYEHWLYVPLIGIVISSVSLASEAVKKFNVKKVGLAILILFMVFFSIQTISRNADWHNPIAFYNQTLKYAPESYRVINNLGMAYANEGLFQKAESIYKKAINLNPEAATAYHNLGNLYENTTSPENTQIEE